MQLETKNIVDALSVRERKELVKYLESSVEVRRDGLEDRLHELIYRQISHRMNRIGVFGLPDYHRFLKTPVAKDFKVAVEAVNLWIEDTFEKPLTEQETLQVWNLVLYATAECWDPFLNRMKTLKSLLQEIRFVGAIMADAFPGYIHIPSVVRSLLDLPFQEDQARTE